MTIIGINRKTIAGGVCLVLMAAGSVLLGGPADARAQHPTTAMGAASSGPLAVAVAGTTLIPGVTSEHAIEITLNVRSANSEVFIERASGTVTLDLGGSRIIDLPLDVRQVQPDAVLIATITIDWDETNPTHRQLRTDTLSAQATFTPNAIRTVELSRHATGPSVATSHSDSAAPTIRASRH